MIQERPGADSASALIPEPASVLSRRSFVGLASSMTFVLGFRVPLPSTSKAADLFFVSNPDVTARDVAKMQRLSTAVSALLDAAA
jgi:hypothetical protein